MARSHGGSHEEFEGAEAWVRVFETVRVQYDALLCSDKEYRSQANNETILRIRDFEERVADLPDDDQIGKLFEKTRQFCLDLINCAETPAERENVRHRFRRLFGVRYSSLLLANIASTDSMSSNESPLFHAAARAAVEEALQWHDDSVLGHVLIYYENREDDAENLLHHCGIVNLPGVEKSRISEAENTFREALRDYVKNYGSSVRTKEHLRVAPLSRILGEDSACDEAGSLLASRLRTVPLPMPKALSEYKDTLELPAEEERRQGDQTEYQKIVRDAFVTVLDLSDSFETKHYSAGSDDLGKTPMRATAHLYVVFKKKKDDLCLDYVLAMRETLSRVTMAYAVDKMQAATKSLKNARQVEKESRKQFEEQVRHLSSQIGVLQTEAEKVISSLTPSVWKSLISWIPWIKKISSSDSRVRVSIGGRISTAALHNWELSQWAMALLKLMDATESDFPADLKIDDAVEAWQFLSKRTFEKSARTSHPMWRCLQRMGLPVGEEFSEAAMARFCPKYNHIRDGFSEAEERGLFIDNDFTMLFLFFAIGASFDRHLSTSCGKQIRLSPMLKAEHVIDGMNRLHDELVDRSPVGIRNAEIKVNQELNQLTVEFKITDFDFGKLCGRMTKKLERQTHPGWSSRSTSMAVFAALGLNEDTWTSDALNQIQISPQDSRVSRKDESGHEFALCATTESGLLLSYDLAQKVGTSSE